MSRNDDPDWSGMAASFSEPVKLARRVDVTNGNREDQPPGQDCRPTPDPAPGPGRPPADDMIAVVDRFQERLEMSRWSRARRPS